MNDTVEESKSPYTFGEVAEEKPLQVTSELYEESRLVISSSYFAGLCLLLRPPQGSGIRDQGTGHRPPHRVCPLVPAHLLGYVDIQVISVIIVIMVAGSDEKRPM